MLKNLFISKVRIKLLQQFLFNPSEEYHVRGLVRLLNEEINAVRRELLNLKDAGILKSDRTGNRLIYKVNPKSPIIHELQSMMYKDSEAGRLLTKAANAIKGVEMVILTHSFMHKEKKGDIDVDVLFVGQIDVRELSPQMKDVEKALGREIRYAVLTMKDFDFGKKKRTAFLLNILENDLILLKGNEKALKM